MTVFLTRPALSPACWWVSGWTLWSQAGAWVLELTEEPAERKDICSPGASGGVTPMGTTCHSHAGVLHPCCATAQPLQDGHTPLAHSLHFWGLCFARSVLLPAAGLPMLLDGCTHCTSFQMWSHTLRFKPSLKSVRPESKWSTWQGLCHLSKGIHLRQY